MTHKIKSLARIMTTD